MESASVSFVGASSNCCRDLADAVVGARTRARTLFTFIIVFVVVVCCSSICFRAACEVAYKALQQSVKFTERNMLNYIWLQNVGSGSGGSTIRVAKPDDVRCFADPQGCDVGPSLNGGPARALSYSCTVGEECAITVPGFSLSDKDSLRVTSTASCSEAHT